MEFRFWKKQEKRDSSIDYNPVYSDALNFSNVFNRYAAMNISAVYRATEIISDSVAILPIKVLDEHKEEKVNHPLNLIFKDRGNNVISKYNLMKLLVQSVILKGNGFALIERANDGTVVGLRYMESGDVTINYDKRKNSLNYTTNLVNRRLSPNDVIHLIKNTYDGVNGISVLSFASRSLGISNSTENSANSFFTNGCNLSGVLTVQGQLSERQKDQIRSSWNQAYSSGGNGLAVIQGNMEYKPIQLSAADSQMLESRQFNVQDISRFFGISPVLLGDLTHLGYATLEATELSFLLHTLQPYITMIENEFNRKLLNEKESNLSINLDETFLLKTDKQNTAQYYNSLLSSGVLSINEVRSELGYDTIENGDEHIIAYTKVQDNIVNKNNDEKKVEKDEKDI